MGIKFMTGGNTVHVFNLSEETALDSLRPKLYELSYNKFDGFYLTIVKDKLQVPSSIYGNTPARVDKCIKTYKSREGSTGILLTGHKGTGKSLLMSLIANQAINELGMPVIMIKSPYSGSQFNSFLGMLGECVIIFDEFGKMYSSGSRQRDDKENDVPQTELLTLLDGVDKTKRMFIMTENEEDDINSFILNRPSRVYYHFKYRKLDEESITDFCIDLKVSSEVMEEILEVSRKSKIFSFDILQTIVEEHLRYGATVTETVEDLNIDLSEATRDFVEIVEVIERDTQTQRELWGDNTVRKPTDGDYTRIYLKRNDDEIDDDTDDDDKYFHTYIEEKYLKYEKGDKCVYENDNFTIVVREKLRPVYDYAHY